MNHSAYIITSAPIQEIIIPNDLFASYDGVARGEIKAPLVPDAADIMSHKVYPFSISSIDNLYTAPDGQTLDTALLLCGLGLIPHAKLASLAELSNIRYSLVDLVSKSSFGQKPTAKTLHTMREMFVRRFFQNKLSMSVYDVLSNFDYILKLSHRYGNHLFIGHSFMMKLLQAYIENPSCYKNEDSLVAVFNPQVKPFEPLQGFSLP